MVGLGSLSGGGVLIAGGGAGCTDCFQDDAESVGASVLGIGGIIQISRPSERKLPRHIVLRFGYSRFNRSTLA
jgi:hypothetical protein